VSPISAEIRRDIRNTFLPIAIEGNTYNIHYRPGFERAADASDDHLEALTDEVLKIFEDLEKQVIGSQSLDVDPDTCHDHLVKLAQQGRRAYRRLFGADAREALTDFFDLFSPVAVPTFVSDVVPFLWEVLYEGQDYHEGDPEAFWGFRYAVGRILEKGRDVQKHDLEHVPELDMLFCLYHKLHHAHRNELPVIEQIVRVTDRDRFNLLRDQGILAGVRDGEALLKYLDKSNHNIIHFACHCTPGAAGVDVLQISLINDHAPEVPPHDIELETGNFEDVEGHFDVHPLVFLNACQSSGGTGTLRRTYNLPRKFIDRRAAAIIATACPVPDLFAAEFARIFYSFFVRGKPETDESGKTTYCRMDAGQSLRATRRYFLEEHHNPLGLAYGLYSPTYYRIALPLD
jgi:hypothetical protein